MNQKSLAEIHEQMRVADADFFCFLPNKAEQHWLNTFVPSWRTMQQSRCKKTWHVNHVIDPAERLVYILAAEFCFFVFFF